MNLIQAAKNVPAKWQKGDLAGAVRALSQSIGNMPETPTEWMNFDAFEMNACTMFYEDDGVSQCFEPCADDHPELHCWSLYGHITGEGVQHIVDFPKTDRALCVFFHDLLNALYKTHEYEAPMSQYDRDQLAR